MDLELTVIKLNKQLHSCSAQTENEILVVFPVPAEFDISVGDRLVLRDFRMDAEVSVIHTATNEPFPVFIRSDNVHDLRLPAAHGTSRTPSRERIGAKQAREVCKK